MARFRLTARAKADLKSIAAYTLRVWGEAQVDRYLSSVESHLQQLADHPLLGRICEDFGDLRRSEHDKHVIFYRRTPRGISVSRILHQRMLTALHSMNDPNE